MPQIGSFTMHGIPASIQTQERPQQRQLAARLLAAIWAAAVVVALLLLEVFSRAGLNQQLYGLVVPLGALGLALATAGYARSHAIRLTWLRLSADRGDLAAIALLYLPVVAVFRLAMVGFGAEHEIPLFLSFAVGLLLGGAGPVIYTVWLRHRPLDDLGIGPRHWRGTLALALTLAGVQYAITLRGYALPAPAEWVPLLAMSLAVGLFEAIFFRGFVQSRLEASFGLVPSVLGAAALYALYHVGYGMGAGELPFLFGLGVVYAIAFRITRNLLVLWPLLIPLGSFFSRLEAADMPALPWIAILGFGEVLAAIGIVIWLAHRRQVRTAVPEGPGQRRRPPQRSGGIV